MRINSILIIVFQFKLTKLDGYRDGGYVFCAERAVRLPLDNVWSIGHIRRKQNENHYPNGVGMDSPSDTKEAEEATDDINSDIYVAEPYPDTITPQILATVLLEYTLFIF